MPGAYVEVLSTSLYARPGGRAVATLPAGARVGVLARSSDQAWFRAVYQPDPEEAELTGWVRARDVVLLADVEEIPVAGEVVPTAQGAETVPAATPTATAAETTVAEEEVLGQATVTARRLNMRAGPGVDQRVLRRLRRGEQVGLVGRTADNVWLQVIRADGEKGWVAAQWLDTNADLEKLPVTGEATTGIPTSTPSRVGGKIVFQTHNGGDIYVIGADGRGLRRLTCGFDPAFSPDGGQVAFTRWDEPRGLWLIDSDGTNEHFLFGAERPRSPTWTADGKAIVFERNVESQACRQTPLGCVTDAQWFAMVGGECMETPFGRYCLGDFPVVTQQVSGLTLYELESGSVRDLPATVDARAPRHSSTDNRVLYLDREGLALTSSQGNATPARLVEGTGLGPAVYSPDGQWIYASRQSGDHWDIWRYRADGSEPLALTAPPAIRSAPINNVSPVVSPDGRTILFLTDRRGRWELWLMNADGSRQRPFAPEALADIEFRYDFANERMADWR
ncbi:MAG: hypothetical protein D6775_09545 [Caldilineae bacterium]|nr:MAG: hypothetical protein D6775_09545 [Caldilineae bacterium]